jgi:ankyrin repeat protein
VIANVDGGTPLHAALINNEEECVLKLVAAGADLNARMCASGNSIVFIVAFIVAFILVS